ncbi:alpha/beta hydrolase [Paenibacillus puerhi]|uniref:alpha/beta hydrolase n=1 Tax=Paenibacillus puerhi TaxID=2692622 RepID=UPI00135CA608|nr:alpha/beta hydrolase [Paenibacillus puerhi]
MGYGTNGDKPTVILLHGLGLNSTAWGSLLDYMSASYHIYTYDLPGHGGEPEAGGLLSWESLSARFAEWADSIGISQAHLIGHGLGANLAVKLAIRYPEKIQTLGLISTPGFFPPESIQRGFESRGKLLRNADRSELVEYMLQSLTVNPRHPDIRNTIYTSFHQVSALSYMQLMDLYRVHDILEDLRQIQQPTMMLCGERDPVYTPALSAITSSYVNNCRFLVVPNASNLTFLDQPEWTSYWLREHIDAIHNMPIAFRPEPSASSLNSMNSLHKIIYWGQRSLLHEHVLQVQVLQSFHISVNGQEIAAGWNKRYAKKLILYLILYPNPTRQQLYDDLWPESELPKAQNYLRVCLNHLKSLLEQHSTGFEFLRIDRENITLQGKIVCDLLDLMHDVRQAMEEKDEIAKETHIIHILDKLPRHLLTGYVDDWILGIRDRLEEQLSVLTLWLSKRRQWIAGNIPIEQEGEAAVISSHPPLLLEKELA